MVRDHYRDSAARVGQFLLEAYDNFYYYRPLVRLIRRGIALGFGNTNVELLFLQGDLNTKFSDVLSPGPFVWSSFDGERVSEVLSSLSICERFKIEVRQLFLDKFSNKLCIVFKIKFQNFFK